MISVVMATYGDDWLVEHKNDILWAKQSVERQTRRGVELVRVHGPSLHEARNSGAMQANGDRLVFLDADDWLSNDFCEKIIEPEDVLQPYTKYVKSQYESIETTASYLEPRESLLDGNHLIVGCPVNRELFLDVGGFDDWPIYEDWALWLKMKKAGATFGRTTGVYYVRHNFMGRNSGPVGSTFDDIRKKYS